MIAFAKRAVLAVFLVLSAAACVPRSYEEVREFARAQLTEDVEPAQRRQLSQKPVGRWFLADEVCLGLDERLLRRVAVGALPFNVEVDVSLIYGDYYFMQALFRGATGRVHDF